MDGVEEDGKKKLILHFDINKTLIISDIAGGVHTEQMINSLISEAAWGKINPESQDWELLSSEASSFAPDSSPGWMTFNEYLENIVKPEKPEKRRAKQTFTEPGQIGESLRPAFERIAAALQLPEEIREKAMQELPMYADGNVFILPSFFNLLVHLQEQERDFSLVFRTFGQDLPKIAEEFNAFCEGRHPMYPSVVMDGTNGTIDRRLVIPTNTGKFFRNGSGPEGMHLAMIDPKKQCVTICHGIDAVWDAILTKAYQNITLGLADCYEWWRDNGESDDSGKLLLVERGGNTLSLFFDDNVERDRAHIVDVRDAHTGERLDFTSESKDRYILKVEPFSAILEPNYYIDALEFLED